MQQLRDSQTLESSAELMIRIDYKFFFLTHTPTGFPFFFFFFFHSILKNFFLSISRFSFSSNYWPFLRSKYGDGDFSYLWIFFKVMLLSTDPSWNQMILYAMGQSKVVVARCSNITIFDKGEMQVTVESLFDFPNIFHLGNASNRDLLALIDIWHWSTHFSWTTDFWNHKRIFL